MKNMDFKYKMNKKVSKKHSGFDEKNKKFLPEMWKSQKYDTISETKTCGRREEKWKKDMCRCIPEMGKERPQLHWELLCAASAQGIGCFSDNL